MLLPHMSYCRCKECSRKVKLNRRGAYLHHKRGGASRGGAHRKTKRALSRKACRSWRKD